MMRVVRTYRELYRLPAGSVVANGDGPCFWIRSHGNSGRWHESTPTGDQLDAVDLICPPDGLPTRMLAVPAVIVSMGGGESSQ